MRKKQNSIEVLFTLDHFKFTHTHLFKGECKIPMNTYTDLSFKEHIDRKLTNHVIETERRVLFRYTLEMHPNIGEINLEGTCDLISSDQKKIDLCITNRYPLFFKHIDAFIRTQCLIKCRILALKNQIPLPPLNILLKLRKK